MLTLVALFAAPVLAAAPTDVAKLDCAGLARAAEASQQARLKLFSSGLADPQQLGRAMTEIGERDAAIQTQREAKKCPGATIDVNDLGK